MAQIELDLTAPADPALSSPPPAHRYRIAGLLFAAVLLIALGGSAPVVPQLWRPAGMLPGAADPQMPFQVVGDRLYTFQPAGDAQTVTVWTLGDAPRRLWTVTLPPPPGDVGFGLTRVEHAGGVVLLADGFQTQVVDARTGAARWSSPSRVTPLTGGRVGVVESERFRPGTTYDQASGLPGPLYFSSTGVPHTEPPLRSEVRGVDLGTGQTIWTAPSSGSVNVLPAPGDAPAVLILSSARIERRDGNTGQVVRQVAMNRADRPGPIGGELAGDVMLVHYSRESGLVAAYAPDTLRELWSRVLPVPVVDPPMCIEVLCSGSRSALDVLDPATGRALWRAPKVDLALRAGYLLETDSDGGRPLRLVDPATGAGQADLTGWLAEVPDRTGEEILLRRSERGRPSSVFGVVVPGRAEVQPLGRADYVLAECAAGAGHVVCRSGDDLRIWAYRV